MICIAQSRPTRRLLSAGSGREFDVEAGLQVNNVRHYDPTVGFWLTVEAAGCQAGNADLHRYCGNQPE
jgi:RHS repeat-associated protein